MKRICVCIALFFTVTLTVFAQTGAIQGHSFLGGKQVITQGLNSTNYSDGIVPSATITVYLTGTTTKATIYADILGTALPNPFTSNALNAVNPGGWIFFAANAQGYDVVASGGMANPSCTTAPNCYVQPVTLCKDCYPSQEFTVSAGVNSAEGITPIEVNGQSGTPIQGNIAISCPTCGGANFQFQYQQQGTGQYVLVPFTSNVCSASTGGSAGDQNGVQGNPAQFGFGFYDIDGGQTGTCNSTVPVLPVGLTAAQITAVYAVSFKSNVIFDGGGSTETGMEFTGTSIVGCSPERNSSTGGAVSTPLQFGCQLTGSLTSEFSTISGAVNGASNPFHGNGSIRTYVNFLEVDYTGSVVPSTGGVVNLGPGFGYNESTDTISLYPYALYPLTVSALNGFPASLTPVGSYNLVIDGANATDCSVGGGTFTVWCEVAASGLVGFPFGGSGGAVASVSSSDGSLTITPTTGNVIASLNAAHANTFSAVQSFFGVTMTQITGLTQCLHVNSSGQISGTGSDCGAGGGGIGGSGTLGHVPLFTPNGTTLGNSHLDEVTTASTDTFTQPVAVASSGPSQQSFTYNATPVVPGSSTTAVYGVNSSGQAVISEAGGAAARACTATNGVCAGGGGSLPTAIAPGQIATATAPGTTYAAQPNIAYQQSGDTIASIEAACSTFGTNYTYVVTSPQTITLSANHTLNACVYLRFEAGGTWTVNGTGFTLTIPSTVSGTLSQHFMLAGTGSVLFGNSQAQVPAEWFGAVGDWPGGSSSSGTNDLLAIQTAIDSMSSGDVVLQALGYYIGTTCALSIDKNFVGLVGTVLQSYSTAGGPGDSSIGCGSATADILDLGNASGSVITGNRVKNLDLYRTVAPTGTTTTGFSINNNYGADIDYVASNDSLRGFYITTAAAGAVGRIQNTRALNCYSSVGGYGSATVIGYYIDGSVGAGLQSTRIDHVNVGNRCNNSTMISYYLNQATDLTLDEAETGPGEYGFEITGSGVSDLHINRPIIDQMYCSGIYFTSFSGYAEINGGYINPQSGSCPTNQAGVDIESSSGITLGNGLQIAGGWAKGDVYLNGSSKVSVQQVNANNCATSGVCIWLNNSNGNAIDDNLLYSTSYGINLVSSSNNTITGNIFTNTTTGIAADSASNNNHYLNLNQIVSSGTLLSDSGTGNQLSGGGSVSVNGSTVSSPNFNGSTPAAPTGGANVTFQVSGSSVSGNIPAATTSVPGVIKPDGTSCTTSAGVLSCGGTSPAWVQEITLIPVSVNNQIFVLGAVPYTVTLASGCTGTHIYSQTAATASTAIVLKDITTSTTLCTATFAASGTTATITGSGGTISPGDQFEVVGPSTADATLANIGGSFAGTHN